MNTKLTSSAPPIRESVERPTSCPHPLVLLSSGVGVGVAGAGCGSGPNGLFCASAGAAGANRQRQVSRQAIRRMGVVAKVLRRGAGERPPPPGEAHSEGQQAHREERAET